MEVPEVRTNEQEGEAGMAAEIKALLGAIEE